MEGLGVLEEMGELTRRGEAFALATVVWRQSPSSSQPGSRAIITAGGELHDYEGRQHDPEQGRDHEQDAPDDIGGHDVGRPYPPRSLRAARSGSYHQVSGMPRK